MARLKGGFEYIYCAWPRELLSIHSRILPASGHGENMAARSEQHSWVAHHEAGHAFIIDLLGLRLDHIDTSATPDDRGAIEIIASDERKTTLKRFSRVQTSFGDRARFSIRSWIAAAGPVAGKIFCNEWQHAHTQSPSGMYKAMTEDGGMNDLKMIGDEIHFGMGLPAIGDRSLALSNTLLVAVGAVLVKRWAVVHALATTLPVGGRMSGRDVHRLLYRQRRHPWLYWGARAARRLGLRLCSIQARRPTP